MSDRIDFDRWEDCSRMERPGFVFEIKNVAGQRLLTPCSHPLQPPWDWKSAPPFRTDPKAQAATLIRQETKPVLPGS